MNEQRRKQLCDVIISHLNNNPDTKYFGRESIIDVFIGKSSRDELNSAIEWLRENKYIKKMGAYTLGFGTGEGLEPYPLDNFDPFELQGKPVKQKAIEPAKSVIKVKDLVGFKGAAVSVKPSQALDVEAIPQFVSAAANKPIRDMLSDKVIDLQDRLDNIEAETSKKAVQITPLKTVLNDEINSIEQALKKTAPIVEQRYEKIGALTRLSLIFSEQQPEVSALLDGIVTDFIELTEVVV